MSLNLQHIWAEADRRERGWRQAGEPALLQQMQNALEGLKSLGWRDGRSAPKDGQRFLAIEIGSQGVFPCTWRANRYSENGGGFWIEAHGDLWPAKPALWKPLSP